MTISGKPSPALAIMRSASKSDLSDSTMKRKVRQVQPENRLVRRSFVNVSHNVTLNVIFNVGFNVMEGSV